MLKCESYRKAYNVVSKKATRGESVIGAMIPNRGTGYPGLGNYNRAEQVMHMKNWTYVAIHCIAMNLAKHVPNIAYVNSSYSSEHGQVQKYSYGGYYNDEKALLTNVNGGILRSKRNQPDPL